MTGDTLLECQSPRLIHLLGSPVFAAKVVVLSRRSAYSSDNGGTTALPVELLGKTGSLASAYHKHAELEQIFIKYVRRSMFNDADCCCWSTGREVFSFVELY